MDTSVLIPTTTAAKGTTTAAATSPITASIRDFYNNLAGTPSSQQAESDVTNFGKLTPNTGSILSAFDEQYGVNAAADRVSNLRKSVMNAEDLVRNVDDNVFARTSNALVSDAQRARLTAAEKDPLLKQLDITNRDFELASGDLSSAREQSNRFSGAEISDIDTMRTSLSQRLSTTQAREATERAQKQQEEENRRWWENFYDQQRQFAETMALQRRQLDAQIASSKSSNDALLASLRAGSGATKSTGTAVVPYTQAKSDEMRRKEALNQELLAAAQASKNSQNGGLLNQISGWWNSLPLSSTLQSSQKAASSSALSKIRGLL